MIYPATLLCDFYKISHREQYPKRTQKIYSTWTPRTSRIKNIDSVVAFGFQAFIKEYLIDYFNENFFNRPLKDVKAEYTRVIKATLGIENPHTQHIEDLHVLGYLPLRIKAVKEGTRVPVKVPMLTVENTLEHFFWLTNYIETLMSCSLWQAATSATIADEYKKILTEYAKKTGQEGFVQFQGHDFSMRGMGSLEAAKMSGAGHLLSFVGTDTIPAILFHEQYYGANIEKELVGTSIPATEHSVMCAGGEETELETYKRIITEVYPKGFVSIVSDTWDLWKVLSDVVVPLKDTILARDGKVVIRPDSGDPVKIVCGERVNIYSTLDDAKGYFEDALYEAQPHGEQEVTIPIERIVYIIDDDKHYKLEADIEWDRYDKQYYHIEEVNFKATEHSLTLVEKGVIEVLWEIFGGTINDKGYKELDPHIGCIYGDAITLERCEEICKQLEAKGFASTNMVYGIGSYTYQYNTRDTFGFALKSTYAKINGKEKFLFKDPITDSGTKKSQTGMVLVMKNLKDDLICMEDMNEESRRVNEEDGIDLLEDVFIDGKLVREQTLTEIRKILADGLR